MCEMEDEEVLVMLRSYTARMRLNCNFLVCVPKRLAQLFPVPGANAGSCSWSQADD